MKSIGKFKSRIAGITVIMLAAAGYSDGQYGNWLLYTPTMNGFNNSRTAVVGEYPLVLAQAKKRQKALNFDGMFDNNPILKDKKGTRRSIDDIDCTTIVVKRERSITLGAWDSSGNRAKGDSFLMRPEVTRKDC